MSIYLPIHSSRESYAQFTCSREELTILVEAYGHDPISSVKGLFHTITVVDVDINVKDAIMVPWGNVSRRRYILCDGTDRRSSRIPKTMSAFA